MADVWTSSKNNPENIHFDMLRLLHQMELKCIGRLQMFEKDMQGDALSDFCHLTVSPFTYILRAHAPCTHAVNLIMIINERHIANSSAQILQQDSLSVNRFTEHELQNQNWRQIVNTFTFIVGVLYLFSLISLCNKTKPKHTIYFSYQLLRDMTSCHLRDLGILFFETTKRLTWNQL